MINLTQLLATSRPRLAREARDIQGQWRAWPRSVPHIPIESHKGIVTSTEEPSLIPDGGSPSLSNRNVPKQHSVQGKGRHVHAAEVRGKGEDPLMHTPQRGAHSTAFTDVRP